MRSHLFPRTLSLLAVASLALPAASQQPLDFPTTDHRWITIGTQAGDPVAMDTGGYTFERPLPLLHLGGPMDLAAELVYRSDLAVVTSFCDFVSPEFWVAPLSCGLNFQDGGVNYNNFQLPNGDIVAFREEPGGWVRVGSAAGERDVPVAFELVELPGRMYLFDPVAERVYMYRREFRPDVIEAIVDRNGNALRYVDTGLSSRRVTDGTGRQLDLNFAVGQNVDHRIVDHTGRTARLRVEFPWGRISQVQEAGGGTTLLAYDTSQAPPFALLTELTRPEGNAPTTQTYGQEGLDGQNALRTQAQTDAVAETWTCEYDDTQHAVSMVRPDASSVVYEHTAPFGAATAITDGAGNTSAFTVNHRQQTERVEDREGGVTLLTYHPSGKLASITNAAGHTTSFTYTPQVQTITNPVNAQTVDFTFYNLTRVDFPDGTFETFDHDARGNVTSRVDRAGQPTAFTYNARGQVLTATLPEGGVRTLTYDAAANLASSTDSETGVTTYGYDALNRLTTVTHPDTTTVTLTWDDDDNLTSITDERGNPTTYAYDGNHRLTRTTDAAGTEFAQGYDALDRLASFSDGRGNTTTLTFDSVGRLASSTDPTGTVHGFGYDARDFMTSKSLGGSGFLQGFSDEGMITSRTTPLGRTETFGYDALGDLLSSTDAEGHTTTDARDAMRRLAGRTDPLGRTTTVGYEPRGLPDSVEAPSLPAMTFTWDGNGQLVALTDRRGQTWQLGRSAMGRPLSTTDPLARSWSHTYDDRGRLDVTTFPDGGTLDRTWDAASNLTRQQYDGGPDLTYGYDALNRLAVAGDVELDYDVDSRVVATRYADPPGAPVVFGATHDAAGRLATVTYPGPMIVTYSYDAATGLLSRVQDDQTGAQVDLHYDADLRWVGLQRSNGVHTTLTWSPDDRLERIQAGTILDLQYTYDAAGQIASADITAPLLAQDALQAEQLSLAYDDASQIQGPGYAYDSRGRLLATPDHTLTWDDASRLTSRDGVTFGYAGTADIATRSEGGTVLRFFHNHAIVGRPRVSERDEASGTFLRHYVFTPQGMPLWIVDVDAATPRFFHYDVLGSTLALTDATGAVSDAWAYDPLGREVAGGVPGPARARAGVPQHPPQPYRPFGARGATADAGLIYFVGGCIDGEPGEWKTTTEDAHANWPSRYAKPVGRRPLTAWHHAAAAYDMEPTGPLLFGGVSGSEPCSSRPGGRVLSLDDTGSVSWQDIGSGPVAPRSRAKGRDPSIADAAGFYAPPDPRGRTETLENLFRFPRPSSIETADSFESGAYSRENPLVVFSGGARRRPTPSREVEGLVCQEIRERVPAAVIQATLDNPSRARQGRQPPGGPPCNVLALRSPQRPYHPIYNALVWRCGCP